MTLDCAITSVVGARWRTLSVISLCALLPLAAAAQTGTPSDAAVSETAAQMFEFLPMGAHGRTPAAFDPAWLLVFALGVPALTWVALAWKRALDSDPARRRRAGLRELRHLLTRLRRKRVQPQPQHLHAWRSAAARVWDVPFRAPTSAQLEAAALSVTGDAALSARWTRLWNTTERGLFAPAGTVTADWVDEATAALAALQPPRRERYFPNRLAYWLPALLTACLVLSVAGGEAAQAQAARDLAAIGQAAHEALERDWNDWAAHRNLAAYHVGQGNWNAAVAHGAAAFALHPISGSGRESLRQALAQTQNVDPVLRRLLFGAWYANAPLLLSAAGWQRVAAAAALLLGGGLTLLVVVLYRRRQRPLLLGGAVTAGCGALLLTAAIVSWNTYGSLRDAQASILLQAADLSPAPTDLVPQEETSPLAAGTIVHARRSFLGWVQIEVSGERRGWVRSNAVMRLYAPL